jgi:hypothetical protein
MSGEVQAPELSEDERHALDLVLDEIIPASPDGRLPGAGQLGVARYVDAALRPTPPLHRMIAEGLAALDAIALRRVGQCFTALPHAARVAALDELAANEHAFPPFLILHAYAGYYQQPRVLAALGLEPRPPHPAGYATVESDLPSLLAPVRRRGRLYRA